MNHRCCLTALGVYTPEHILSNNDLCALVDTSDEWITSRTGIRFRRKMADTETTSDMAVAAARQALERASLQVSDITHIIVGTCTPEKLCPSVASLTAGKLGAGHCMAFDFTAACSGYLSGLSICRGLLLAEPQARILLICAEAMSRRMNWSDRSTCVLFGDGAAACVLSADANAPLAVLRDVLCAGDGSLGRLITFGGGTEHVRNVGDPIGEDYFLQMQGREVFKHAVRRMADICQEALSRNGLSIDDVDVLVPHQANMRIIEAVGDRLHIAPEKVFTNVADYGNTSAASVPLALDDALGKGAILPGQRVLCTSFGAGLTWSAALMEF